MASRRRPPPFRHCSVKKKIIKNKKNAACSHPRCLRTWAGGPGRRARRRGRRGRRGARSRSRPTRRGPAARPRGASPWLPARAAAFVMPMRTLSGLLCAVGSRVMRGADATGGPRRTCGMPAAACATGPRRGARARLVLAPVATLGARAGVGVHAASAAGLVLPLSRALGARARARAGRGAAACRRACRRRRSAWQRAGGASAPGTGQRARRRGAAPAHQAPLPAQHGVTRASAAHACTGTTCMFDGRQPRSARPRIHTARTSPHSSRHVPVPHALLCSLPGARPLGAAPAAAPGSGRAPACPPAALAARASAARLRSASAAARCAQASSYRRAPASAPRMASCGVRAAVSGVEHTRAARRTGGQPVGGPRSQTLRAGRRARWRPPRHAVRTRRRVVGRGGAPHALLGRGRRVGPDERDDLHGLAGALLVRQDAAAHARRVRLPARHPPGGRRATQGEPHRAPGSRAPGRHGRLPRCAAHALPTEAARCELSMLTPGCLGRVFRP